jgi:hypothetical protein
MQMDWKNWSGFPINEYFMTSWLYEATRRQFIATSLHLDTTFIFRNSSDIWRESATIQSYSIRSRYNKDDKSIQQRRQVDTKRQGSILQLLSFTASFEVKLDTRSIHLICPKLAISRKLPPQKTVTNPFRTRSPPFSSYSHSAT